MARKINSTHVKIAISFAIGLYAAAFVVFNANYRTDVWLFFFIKLDQVSTLTVMLISAGLALALGWVGIWWIKRGTDSSGGS